MLEKEKRALETFLESGHETCVCKHARHEMEQALSHRGKVWIKRELSRLRSRSVAKHKSDGWSQAWHPGIGVVRVHEVGALVVGSNPCQVPEWTAHDIRLFHEKVFAKHFREMEIAGAKLYFDVGDVRDHDNPKMRKLLALTNHKDGDVARLAWKTLITLFGVSQWTISTSFLDMVAKHGVLVGDQALPSHAFGLVFDREGNELQQPVHVEGFRGEAQVLVHCAQGQPGTLLYTGEKPTVEEFLQQAQSPYKKEDIRDFRKGLLQDITWAMLPRDKLEAAMIPSLESSEVGDVGILCGSVAHAGPACRTARMMVFCALGGTRVHDTSFQANPWVIAEALASPLLSSVVNSYSDHRPEKFLGTIAARILKANHKGASRPLTPKETRTLRDVVDIMYEDAEKL